MFDFFFRIMRNEELTNGVFQDPEEFNFYKRMFNDLISIMHQIGFTEEVFSLFFKLFQ